MTNPNPFGTTAAVLSRLVRDDLPLGEAPDADRVARRAVELEAALRQLTGALGAAGLGDADAVRAMADQLTRLRAGSPGGTPILPDTVGRSLRQRGLPGPAWLVGAPPEPPPAPEAVDETPVRPATEPEPHPAPEPVPAPAPSPASESAADPAAVVGGRRVRYCPEATDAVVRDLPERVVGAIRGPDATRPGYVRVLDGCGDLWVAPADRCEELPPPVTAVRRALLPPAPPADLPSVLVDEAFDGAVRFVIEADRTEPVEAFAAGVAYTGLLIAERHGEPEIVVRFGARPDPVGTYVAGLDNTRYAVSVVPAPAADAAADAEPPPEPPRVLSAVATVPDAWAPNPGDPWPEPAAAAGPEPGG